MANTLHLHHGDLSYLGVDCYLRQQLLRFVTQVIHVRWLACVLLCPCVR